MSAAMSDRRRLGLPSKKSEDEVIDELVRRMRVRMHDTEDPVSTLSGGNQQKVAIGKWLARGPDVMLLDEPTRGVDVAAKAEVHGLLRDIAADGAALLVSSSELSELLGLCHRVLVMAQGRIVGETDTADADEETLLRYITLAPRESA
jgi:ABC-type sugar transport system ATPase subunit